MGDGGTDSTAVFSSFPQDGRIWTLEWIGPISALPGEPPAVVVQLAPQGSTGRREFARVDIGSWPWLTLGSAWRDGTAVPSLANQALRRRRLTIAAASDYRIHRAYDRVDGRYLIPQSRYFVERFAAGSFVVRLRTKSTDVGDLLIPCTELFRAFFGGDGKLAQMILTGYLFGNDRIYDKTRSLIQPGDGAFVWLGKHMRDAFAEVVAFIAFDPVAAKTIETVISETAAASVGRSEYHLKLGLPFSRSARLMVEGYPLGGAHPPRFLVTQILRLNVDRPYRWVESYRDNPGGDRAPDDAPRTAFAGSVKVTRPSVGEMRVGVGLVPSAREAPHVVRLTYPSAWYPRLEHVVHNNPSPRRRSASVSFDANESGQQYSTGAAAAKGSASPLEMQGGDGLGAGRPGDLDFFQEALEHMRTIAVARRRQLNLSHDLVQFTWSGFHRVTWARMRGEDGALRPRRAVVARIACDGVEVTLWEIERRHRPSGMEALATIGVFAALDEKQLEAAFYACAVEDGRIVRERFDAVGLPAVASIWLKHTKDTPEGYAQRIFDRLFHDDGPHDRDAKSDNRVVA